MLLVAILDGFLQDMAMSGWELHVRSICVPGSVPRRHR
jgi:hypothetical protein